MVASMSSNARGSNVGFINTWQALYCSPRRSVTRKKWNPKSDSNTGE